MRIAVHCVYFPPEVGGLESHIHFLCKGLVERGHSVDVVTSRSRPDLPAREVIDGIRVWRTPLPGRHTAGWALHALGSTPRFRALAREADVLHAQDIAAVPPCLAARRAAPRAGLVTTYHTSHFLRRAASPFWRPVFRGFLRAADHNLAASEEIAAVARSLAPGVEIEALANGVDTGLFHRGEPALPPPPEGRIRIIVPRRLVPKNGVEFLVRAVPLVVAEVDAEAVVVGDGPERARLEALAAELGLGDRVRFLGARPHADMPGLLSSADLAVFPSLMEATSVAALEAMASEVPVVATSVGGLPEIVDDGVGALCRPADPEDLARTVVRIVREGQLTRLGAAARRRVVERWSNDRLVDRHVQIYERVRARRTGREHVG